MTQLRQRWWVIALFVGALALAGSSFAAADDPDPLNGEATVLSISAGVAEALEGAGVSVTPTGDAEAHGGGVAFPVTGGKLDPSTLEGKVKHSGGLKFKSDGGKVSIGDFVVELGAKPALIANPGKNELKVFNLGLSSATTGRDGFATEASGIVPVLTGKAAKALNKALDVDVFAGGLEVGTVSTRLTPKSVALLPEGDTTLALDEGAATALESLGITPGVIAPATAGADGLSFPITGGRVNATTLAGQVTHSGGISLTKGPTVVELKKFTINIDEKPDLTAKVGGDRVSILNLDLSGATIEIEHRSVTVSGVDATLTKAAAKALNGAFDTDAFSKGLLIGSATVSAEAR